MPGTVILAQEDLMSKKRVKSKGKKKLVKKKVFRAKTGRFLENPPKGRSPATGSRDNDGTNSGGPRIK